MTALRVPAGWRLYTGVAKIRASASRIASRTAARSSGPSAEAVAVPRIDAFLPCEMSRAPGRDGGFGGITTDGMWIHDVAIEVSCSEAADRAALSRISELLHTTRQLWILKQRFAALPSESTIRKPEDVHNVVFAQIPCTVRWFSLARKR